MPVNELELWGGIECTVNRLRDAYSDQLKRSGHCGRVGDLDAIAGLGIRTLRYPVLWERTATGGTAAAEQMDWSWADERLGRLRELEVRPIVGLVHHGSGPRHTALTSPCFASGLEAYARAVAERFPWVDLYTPVNEPLTTARFSALYGFWYPHRRDQQSFLRALLNQCRAVVLAMRAIREVNPAARLVQTDDLGHTASAARLAYQAAHENARRWLTWDILTGRLDARHPLWRYFLAGNIAKEELYWFLENPCPPDVIGINYYLTSERYLDERVEEFPEWARGGNGRHRYADVAALRAGSGAVVGPEKLLAEAWERYGIPLAVTEVHLGCTREEQLRWLLEVWNAARRARVAGADVRAVTVWALLGSYDWPSLLRKRDGVYESGPFDVRAPSPRKTGLADMAKGLAGRGAFEHPVLASPGWWRRPERICFVPAAETAEFDGSDFEERPALPILITGARGTLGRALRAACEARGLAHVALGRTELDIADAEAVERVMSAHRPWAIVNAAGFVRVDDAERECEACRRANVTGPATLAAACAKYGARLVTFSSDLVFSGQKAAPYLEHDEPGPLNEYGASKLAAERRVSEILPEALLLRTSAFFGPEDEWNFVTTCLREIAAGRSVRVAEDAWVSPTYVPDLVNATLDLLIDGERGVWHLANAGATTWAALAEEAASRLDLDQKRLHRCATADLGLAARRPLYSVLGSERGGIMPKLTNALDRYLQACQCLSTRRTEAAEAAA